jgi:hypothetical protein
MATVKFNGHRRSVQVIEGRRAQTACDQNLLAPAPTLKMSSLPRSTPKGSMAILGMLAAAVGFGKDIHANAARKRPALHRVD